MPLSKQQATQEAINVINSKLKNITTYSADFKFYEKNELVDKGHIIYRASPMRKKMISSFGSTKDKDAVRIYYDDYELWYVPAQNIVITKKRPKKNGESSSGYDLGKFPSDKINLIGNDTKNNIYIFEYYFDTPPKPYSADIPVKGIMKCNSRYGYAENIKMFNKDGVLISEQTFDNYKLNIPIKDSEFEFMPPPDAQVVNWDTKTGRVGPVYIKGSNK
jgi:outer membrane lipoprotein-sorting protein